MTKLQKTKCCVVLYYPSVGPLQRRDLNYLVKIVLCKSHSREFPQNATKSIMLFAPLRLVMNKYFNNGFTPIIG